MQRLLAGLLMMLVLNACWCGSDGPPRPPQAMPNASDSPEDLTPQPQSLP